jgi:hypothetical protein
VHCIMAAIEADSSSSSNQCRQKIKLLQYSKSNVYLRMQPSNLAWAHTTEGGLSRSELLREWSKNENATHLL